MPPAKRQDHKLKAPSATASTGEGTARLWLHMGSSQTLAHCPSGPTASRHAGDMHICPGTGRGKSRGREPRADRALRAGRDSTRPSAAMLWSLWSGHGPGRGPSLANLTYRAARQKRSPLSLSEPSAKGGRPGNHPAAPPADAWGGESLPVAPQPGGPPVLLRTWVCNGSGGVGPHRTPGGRLPWGGAQGPAGGSDTAPQGKGGALGRQGLRVAPPRDVWPDPPLLPEGPQRRKGPCKPTVTFRSRGGWLGLVHGAAGKRQSLDPCGSKDTTVTTGEGLTSAPVTLLTEGPLPKDGHSPPKSRL